MADPEILDNPQKCWKDFLQGDHTAFSLLFKAHYSALYQYAYRQFGEAAPSHESVQHLFYQLWMGRANISEVVHVKAYLFKALRNALQKEKKYQQRFLQLEHYKSPLTFSQEEVLLDDEAHALRKRKIAESLNQLPKRQREIIYLKYYEELSYQQIADVLDMNYQSVVNTVFRAIQKLREEKTLKHLVMYSAAFPFSYLLYCILT